MKSSRIILAGIAGTTIFTLFSYLATALLDEDFKQPKFLGKLIYRADNDLNKEEAAFTGWISHYLIGIGFAAAYNQLISLTGMKPTIKNGIAAGAVTAVPAMLTWYTTLDLHPAPPKDKEPSYFMELFFGHILFGAGCFWVLGRRKSRNNNQKTILKQCL
ncbi:MAG: hypothetical protein ABIP30_11985 [Ferruginibacter sp.]